MLKINTGHGAEYLLGSVASGRESYYLDATTDGEPPGQWNGSGAAAFGLTGEVDAEEMAALYGSFMDPRDPAFPKPDPGTECATLGSAPRTYRAPEDVLAAKLAKHPDALPEQVAKWRAQAERKQRDAVMFEDATLGAPKSITVLHAAYQKAELEAQRAGDLQAASEWAGRRAKVESAIHAGNVAMLNFMAEKAGYARVGGDRSGRAVQHHDAHDWTIASFFQHTNRDLEPHLHVHNPVLNRVLLPDGRVYALNGEAMRHWVQAGGALAERVMQEEMTRTLGLQWRLNEAGHTREVVGIDKDILDLFSERTAKLTAKAKELAAALEERLGRELTPLEHNHINQQATLATRKAKSHHGETQEQMLDRWHAKLRNELAGGLHRVAARFDSPGVVGELEKWSPHAVVVRALDAVQENRATWTRPELMRQIDLALPATLGLDAAGVAKLVEKLADLAIGSDEVIQTAGTLLGRAPSELQRPDGASVYASPSGDHFATRQHVIAEEALRRAAVDRGRLAVPLGQAERWLADHAGMLGPDQAAAVLGIATSGAGLVALVGPAGAGKSHTAGAIAASWSDLTGGQVIGLATTQVATEVLKDDGVKTAANISQWLIHQKQIAEGSTRAEVAEWRLKPNDIVLVDEASMMSTQHMTAVRQYVDAAGARMILAGDPAQLGAVGAGGMMALLADGEAETYSLSDVRRFTAGWERAASLRLRDGDTDVVREYDRHGRIIDGGLPDDAAAMAARAYVADRVAGKSSVIITGSNDSAAALSALVRERLVELGQVEADGVVLGRDGCTAGVGDIVAARRIDWELGVLNRRQYEVQEVREDGSLVVVSLATGVLHELPASYVGKDLTLGYAGTVHSTQGQTVDTAHTVMDERAARDATYVAMSRGRECNTAYVATRQERDPLARNIDVPAPEPRTATAVFADVLERDFAQKSATAEIQDYEEWSKSAATLDARVEDAVRTACLARTGRSLDALVEDGVLSEGERARLGADQGTEYLSRVLRAAEQAGNDPDQVLRSAIEGRDFKGRTSLAQTLSARITKSVDLAVSDRAPVPAGLSSGMTEYIADLRVRADARRADLGRQVLAERPDWALAALGAPPEDDADALGHWMDAAAAVAAHREASGWDSQEAAVGPAPGIQATERRASWHQAWDALGRPEAQAEEGDLSEGRLRNRVAAARRMQEWAPDFVDDQLKASSLAARQGEQDAALAGAEGNSEDAAKFAAEAEDARSAVRSLDESARERGRWFMASAVTRETGVRAEAELESRGIAIGEEPDLTTASDFLLEVVNDEDEGPILVQREVPRPDMSRTAPAAGIPTEMEAGQMLERARWAAERMNDHQSEDESHLGSEEWAAVDEESRAWEDADGSEEAVIATEEVAGA